MSHISFKTVANEKVSLQYVSDSNLDILSDRVGLFLGRDLHLSLLRLRLELRLGLFELKLSFSIL
jgi:hypothetical protein